MCCCYCYGGYFPITSLDDCPEKHTERPFQSNRERLRVRVPICLFSNRAASTPGRARHSQVNAVTPSEAPAVCAASSPNGNNVTQAPLLLLPPAAGQPTLCPSEGAHYLPGEHSVCLSHKTANKWRQKACHGGGERSLHGGTAACPLGVSGQHCQAAWISVFSSLLFSTFCS